MGSTAVIRALDRSVTPVDYSSRVMQHYARLYAELRDVMNARVRN
jgi:hypothetical protein